MEEDYKFVKKQSLYFALGGKKRSTLELLTRFIFPGLFALLWSSLDYWMYPNHTLLYQIGFFTIFFFGGWIFEALIFVILFIFDDMILHFQAGLKQRYLPITKKLSRKPPCFSVWG